MADASALINRNRSQGGYGIPISQQKFLNLNATWGARKQMDEEFAKTSLKYGENCDLRPTKVPLNWTLTNTCQAVK